MTLFFRSSFFIFLISLPPVALCEIIENSSLSTSYPWVDQSERIFFEASTFQKKSVSNGSSSFFSVKSHIPVSTHTLGLIQFQTNGNLTLGMGYQAFEEYEYSLYTPNTFIYFNQTLPYLVSQTQATTPETSLVIPLRLQDSQTVTTVGIFVLKELDQTDLYSELQLNYHHPKEIKNTELNQMLRVSEQYSGKLDFGLQYYFPDSRFTFGLSTGGELRSNLRVALKEQDSFANERGYAPYVHVSTRLSYAFSQKFFLQAQYQDETMLSTQQNSDEERTVTLKAQYQLF